ncbi:hypothetical protein [Embleya sp. NPDC001921]
MTAVPGGSGCQAAGDPARQGVALDRVVAAAADRERIAGEVESARTVDACRIYRGALRDAVAVLHAAVVDAHRERVAVREIAAAAGMTAGAVRVVVGLGRGRDRVGGSGRQALEAVGDALRIHGAAHPATHRAIVEAHALGVELVRIADVVGVSAARVCMIVLSPPVFKGPVRALVERVLPPSEEAGPGHAAR